MSVEEDKKKEAIKIFCKALADNCKALTECTGHFLTKIHRLFYSHFPDLIKRDDIRVELIGTHSGGIFTVKIFKGEEFISGSVLIDEKYKETEEGKKTEEEFRNLGVDGFEYEKKKDEQSLH